MNHATVACHDRYRYNVLLRYLVFDDEMQSKKAAKLIDAHQSIYVSHIVLVDHLDLLRRESACLNRQQSAGH